MTQQNSSIYELWLQRVQQNGVGLQHVPEPLRTAELCLAAVQQDGRALEFVPEPLRTAEVCLAAAHQYRDALKHVPAALLAEVEARLSESAKARPASPWMSM